MVKRLVKKNGDEIFPLGIGAMRDFPPKTIQSIGKALRNLSYMLLKME